MYSDKEWKITTNLLYWWDFVYRQPLNKIEMGFNFHFSNGDPHPLHHRKR